MKVDNKNLFQGLSLLLVLLGLVMIWMYEKGDLELLIASAWFNIASICCLIYSKLLIIERGLRNKNE